MGELVRQAEARRVGVGKTRRGGPPPPARATASSKEDPASGGGRRGKSKRARVVVDVPSVPSPKQAGERDERAAGVRIQALEPNDDVKTEMAFSGAEGEPITYIRQYAAKYVVVAS